MNVSGRALILATALLASGVSMAASADKPPLKLSTIMKNAAYLGSAVRSEGKKIDATREQQLGVILDQLSFYGSFGVSRTDRSVRAAGREIRGRVDAQTSTFGVQLVLSVETLFLRHGLELTEDMQKAGLAELRMQVAAQGAQSYMDYLQNELRIAILEKLKIIVEGISQAAGASKGNSRLSQANQAILAGLMTDITTALRSSGIARESAANLLEIILGDSLPETLELSGPSRSRFRAMSEGQRSSALDTAGKKLRSQSSVDADRFFPVPATKEQAIEQALIFSPSLQVARVAEQIAGNNYDLRIARQLPTITLYAEKSRSDNRSHETSLATDSEGATIGARLSMRIGAGIFNSLRSDEYLEEAAHLGVRAVELKVRGALGTAYPRLTLAREQIAALDNQLVRDLEQLLIERKRLSDANFQQFVHLINAVQSNSLDLMSIWADYFMSRVKIHQQMGSLLGEMDRLEAEEAKL